MSMKGSKSVGTVSAHVLPDTTDFASTLKSYLDGLEKSLKASIRIVTDAQQVSEEAAKAHEVMQEEAGKGIHMDVELARLAEAREKAEALAKELSQKKVVLDVDADTEEARSKALASQQQIDLMKQQSAERLALLEESRNKAQEAADKQAELSQKRVEAAKKKSEEAGQAAQTVADTRALAAQQKIQAIQTRMDSEVLTTQQAIEKAQEKAQLQAQKAQEDLNRAAQKAQDELDKARQKAEADAAKAAESERAAAQKAQDAAAKAAERERIAAEKKSSNGPSLDAAQRAKWEAEFKALAKEAILRIPASADSDHLRLSIEKAVEEAKAGIHARIPVDADPVAYRAKIDGLIGDLKQHVASLPVEADTKKAEKSFSDIKSKITDIGGAIGGVIGKSSSLVSSFGMFAGKAEVFTGIGMAAVSATGGIASLISSTTALLGVAALLPAAGAMFGAVLGTGAAAVAGVGGALSAIDAKKAADSSSAPKVDPQVQAIQYEQAQEAIARAQDQSAQSQIAALQAIHSAEESQVKALEDEKIAQQNLNIARADAVKNMRDLNLELASANVKRQQDAQSMQAAEDAYNLARFDHSKSSASIQQTKLEFEAKKIAYQQELNSVGDLKQKTDQANAKDVEGADNVVAAKRSLRDANWSAIDSENALGKAREDANRSAVQGAQAIHDAQRSLLLMQLQQADAARQANAATVDAMAKLSPSAREAVGALETVKGELKGVQQIAQENFFQGFAAPLLSLVSTLLPQLKTGVGAIATSMGNGVKDLFGSMEKSLGSGGLGKMLGNFASAIDIANQAISPMVGAFSTLATVGSTFLPQLATGWSTMATNFDNFIKKSAATGDLQKFIQGGIDAVKKLGDAFGSAIDILGSIGKAALAAGGSTLDSFATGLKQVADMMNSKPFQAAMTTIFSGAKAGMDGLFTALKPIGDMFVALSPTIKVVATLVGKTLASALTGVAQLLSDPSFMQGIQGMFKGFQKGVDALAPVLPKLGPALGSLGQLIGEIAAQLGPVLGDLLAQLAPVLGVVIDALIPLVKDLGEMLKAVIPVLTPILQAAGGIALALIGIIRILVDSMTAQLKVTQAVFDPKMWADIGAGFGKFFENMGSQIKLGWDTIVKFFGDGINGIRDWLTKLFVDGVKGFADFGRYFDDVLASIPRTIQKALGGAGNWLFNIGKDLINGLFRGINSMAADIGKFFLSILPGWMVEPFKVALGIHSPSRVFMGFGENIADGVSIGVGNRKAALNTQVANMVTVPKVPTISPVFGAAASTGANSNGRQSVFGDVIFQKADNPDAVATAIERRFTRRM